MSARTVKQMFDVLWGELARIVAKPVVVGDDNVDTLTPYHSF